MPLLNVEACARMVSVDACLTPWVTWVDQTFNDVLMFEPMFQRIKLSNVSVKCFGMWKVSVDACLGSKCSVSVKC